MEPSRGAGIFGDLRHIIVIPGLQKFPLILPSLCVRTEAAVSPVRSASGESRLQSNQGFLSLPTIGINNRQTIENDDD